MAKTKLDRIQDLQANIATAEQRIRIEEEKISAARKRIKAEQKRIRDWKDGISHCEASLIAERFRASNMTLEDALAAFDLQTEEKPAVEVKPK